MNYFYKKDESFYDCFRSLFGICENEEIEDRIPFTVNMDFFNAIYLHKDKFIGGKKIINFDNLGSIIIRIFSFFFSKDE